MGLPPIRDHHVTRATLSCPAFIEARMICPKYGNVQMREFENFECCLACGNSIVARSMAAVVCRNLEREPDLDINGLGITCEPMRQRSSAGDRASNG
jgi:hypothetical protein